MTNVFTLDAMGITDNAIKLARKFKSERIITITVKKDTVKYSGSSANVKFIFDDNDIIEIIQGFGIGYNGTGPTGLYTILTQDFNIDPEKAEAVFVPWAGDEEIVFNLSK